MKSSEIIARVREGVFTHSGPEAVIAMFHSTLPSESGYTEDAIRSKIRDGI